MAAENAVVENDELDLDDQEELSADDLEIVIDDSDEVEVEAEETAEAEPEVEPEQEAEPEQVAEATDDEPDAELASMPDKIKKRFAREKRLRDTIINEREQIKAAAIQVAQVAKQREDEVVTLKKQNAALQRQFAETLDYAYERDIVAKAQEVRKAREDGNYDDELKAQSELETLRFQHNQVRQAKTTLPDPDKIVSSTPAPAAQAEPQQAPQQGQRPPPAPLAVKWIADNKTWFDNPTFKSHRAAVLDIDSTLKNEGYDPGTKDYYQELDSRIDSMFPALRKKRKPTASPVAPAGNSPAASKSKTTITITKSDVANMRRFGLDPANKEQLREYALSKRA